MTREVQLAVEMQLQFQNQVKKKRFKKYMPCAYLYTWTIFSRIPDLAYLIPIL